MTFPHLHGAELLALDIETKDPDLLDLGPGPRRPDGKVLGVGVADGKRSFYFPVAHPLSENVELGHVIAWLNELKPKALVGANLLYDLDWLTHHGMKVERGGPKLYDVQLAEPLLDENKKSFALDFLGKQYLGTGKKEDALKAYCDKQGWKGKPQGHLWKMPATIVAPYCQGDAEVTFDVLQRQLPLLEEQGLRALFEMECGLLPLLLKMRQVGVRFNVEKLHENQIIYQRRIREISDEVTELAGWWVNVNAARSIAQAFQSLGVKYTLTDKGNPKFDEASLEQIEHPLAKKILEQRRLETVLGTFLTGLERHVVKGRIHSQFHPLRGDEYGAVSGRFSGSNPNLQQMPSDGQSKDDVRGLFLPEVDHDWWKLDYSQIELRVLAHYAQGQGAEEIRGMYRTNPDIDFHQACADMIGVPRRTAKSINFGVVYGMGREKLARKLGLAYEEAVRVLQGYHAKMPFLKNTSRMATNAAERRGYVKTLMGRRRRFPDKRWCYRALNAVIQGSAADIMKAAMVKSWEAGLYDVLVPHLTVHDELDISVPRTLAGSEAALDLKALCEDTARLGLPEFRVPLRVEAEIGETWASVKKAQHL